MPPDPYTTVTGREVRVYTGVLGVRFNAEIADETFQELADATRTEFVFKAPSGVEKRKPASQVNPPDGESRVYIDQYGNVTALVIALEYRVDDATLFDEVGTWQVWIEVEQTGVYNYPGAPSDLEVFAPGSV